MDEVSPAAGPGRAWLSPDWWANALTRDERRDGAPAVRPSWADTVEHAVAAAAPPEVIPPCPESPDPTLSADDWRTALAVPLRPFLDAVRRRLAEGARDCLPARQADPEKAAEAYTAVFGRQIARVAARTLAFELEREPDADDGQRRLADFLGRLCTPVGLAALFTEYPVLARLLGVASGFAAEAGVELLSRFAADRPEIVAELLGDIDPGPVVAIEPGLGDSHCEGRSVAAVSFADGRRVIYKPRSLSAHAVFGRVTEWLNQRVPDAGLRTPRTVTGPGYGWLEFIASEPLPRRRDAADFYRREGLLLAALYATRASDMHCENLIASGATPVLIDVETLFKPVMPMPRVTAADPAAEALAVSVRQSALLPQVTAGDNGVSDQSGMTGDYGRDRAVGNRPCYGGEAIGPDEHTAAILDGFRLGYDAIVADRDSFAGLIEPCGDIEVRAILRPSSSYARLADESTHPDLLRDAADRDRALDVLREVSAHHPLWNAVADHELADLRNGDIPLFTGRPASPDIWTSAGQRRPRLLDRPGLRCALEKVATMGEVDRRNQEWLILSSLAARKPYGGHRDTPLAAGRFTATAAEPGRLLAAACGLADQIVARAFAAPGETGRVNWLGLQLVEDTQWMVLPMGGGLADGYLGVALFLAQLADLTGIDRYSDVARRAISALPDVLESLSDRPELVAAIGCGGFAGLGGIGYGLARMSTLLSDAELRRWAVRAAELAAMADLSAAAGWATGTAGCLAAMAAVHAECGITAAAGLARACADHLSELAERTNGRCALDDGQVPSGFAAGPAGIGWALARYAGIAGDSGYLAAGHLAIRRGIETTVTDGSPGWCSGSAGLLLARSCLPAGVGELDADAYALGHQPARGDLSLCHGELGIAEVLTVVSEMTASTVPYRARRHRAGLILDVMSRRSSYCGTPDGIPTPGLLSGLAGIGYGLLRLGFAGRVPSLLLLEPSDPGAKERIDGTTT